MVTLLRTPFESAVDQIADADIEDPHASRGAQQTFIF